MYAPAVVVHFLSLPVSLSPAVSRRTRSVDIALLHRSLFCGSFPLPSLRISSVVDASLPRWRPLPPPSPSPPPLLDSPPFFPPRSRRRLPLRPPRLRGLFRDGSNPLNGDVRPHHSRERDDSFSQYKLGGGGERCGLVGDGCGRCYDRLVRWFSFLKRAPSRRRRRKLSRCFLFFLRRSDLVVLWPTISSSSVLWTLSHRSTTTTTMPQLVSSPNTADPSIDSDGNFAVVAELSSTSGSESPAVVSFTRPLTMADGYVGNYQLEREVNQVRRHERFSESKGGLTLFFRSIALLVGSSHRPSSTPSERPTQVTRRRTLTSNSTTCQRGWERRKAPLPS